VKRSGSALVAAASAGSARFTMERRRDAMPRRTRGNPVKWIVRVTGDHTPPKGFPFAYRRGKGKPLDTSARTPQAVDLSEPLLRVRRSERSDVRGSLPASGETPWPAPKRVPVAASAHRDRP
jgi:hypothetical protein